MEPRKEDRCQPIGRQETSRQRAISRDDSESRNATLCPSIYRDIIAEQERVRAGSCLRSIKDESNPPDIVIRLHSVSRHSRDRAWNGMIGEAYRETRSSTRAKRKDAGSCGVARMMVGTFGISRRADDDESTCSATRSATPLNSLGRARETERIPGGCSILRSSPSRGPRVAANSLWNSYRIGDLTVRRPLGTFPA